MTELQTLFNLDIEAYLQGPMLVLALMGLGLMVGVLTGLFGVGGAFAVTPMLNVVFGIPYQLVLGSSLSFTIGTSISGVRRHIRLENFESRTMLILAGTSMVGAWLGAMFNGDIRQALGEYHYTLTMHVLFIVMLLTTAWLIGRKNDQEHSGPSLLQRLPIPPHIDLPAAELKNVSLPGLMGIGLSIGLVNGMLGIGGGVLFMPLLTLVVGLSPHAAVGTSLGVVVFSAMAGTLKYALAGDVNLWIVMSLLVSSVIGVQIGAYICQRLHAAKLKRYFAFLVLLVALMVLIRFVHDWRKGSVN